MANWGKVDFSEFKKLQESMNSISDKANIDRFCKDCCKELAARLLALVIPKTVVGMYPKESGKKGGTLRRGWGPKKASDAASYANSLKIDKAGGTYTIEIINPVDYASYVEFGHRTRSGTGWVEGKFMLTISEENLKRIAPTVLERKLNIYLKEAFNV